MIVKRRAARFPPAHVGAKFRRPLHEPDPAVVGFILELGRALHSAGHSAQRLEDTLGAIAERLGLLNPQFFSTPTSIMASFGPIGRQRTHMLRVMPGEVNLGTLVALEQVSLEVAQGRMSPGDGTGAISRITSAPSPYGPGITTLAYGVSPGRLPSSSAAAAERSPSPPSWASGSACWPSWSGDAGGLAGCSSRWPPSS